MEKGHISVEECVWLAEDLGFNPHSISSLRSQVEGDTKDAA